MIDSITYTTQPSSESNGRYITVYAPDGSYVSRHRNMEECTESAIAHAAENNLTGDLEYRFVPPEKHMRIRRTSVVLPDPVSQTVAVNSGSGDVSAVGTNPSVSTTDPTAPISGIFVDGQNGNDSWNGTAAEFVSGTTGPKATISAGISACSVGTSLYLLNNQTYGFATYDLDWNSGSATSQAAGLYGCYVSGGTPYIWTEASGEARPVFIGRFRSTNDNFTIQGIEFNNASWLLRATNVNNFTFQYNEVNRSGSDTSDCILFSGSAGSKGLWILNNEFTWAESGIDWSGGNDMVAINTYYKYIEVANNTFTRAPHDCLSIASGPHYVHDNTFSNVDSSEDEGYRCASFNAERDPTGSSDGGVPYGHGLVENNTFLSSNAPSDGENIAQTIKMQQVGTIYRLNSFDLRTSGGFTQNEVWNIQTCCNDDNSKAPLVAGQRIYNNYVTAEACRRWAGRIRTSQTDGSLGTENTRTELHSNWIFNNHFDGEITDLNEAMFEFHEIGASYRVGNAISQNKVEYNSFSSSKSDEFLQDATNGVQTLAQAEANWPAYVNNNTTNSSGGSGLGRDLTTTTGSGSSTTLSVVDAGVFQPRIYDADVGEIYAGDDITVNGQSATVTGRDLGLNTLTVSPAVTWSSGQAVNLLGTASGYTGIPAASVTGSLGDGNTLVITADTGEDFGSTGPVVELFDDYRNGTIGSTQSATPTYSETGQTWNTAANLLASDANFPNDRGVNLLDANGNSYISEFLWKTYPDSDDEVFISYSFRYPTAKPDANTKMLWLGGENPSSPGEWYQGSLNGNTQPDLILPSSTSLAGTKKIVGSNDTNATRSTWAFGDWLSSINVGEVVRHSYRIKGTTSSSTTVVTFRQTKGAGVSEWNYENYKALFVSADDPKGFNRFNYMGFISGGQQAGDQIRGGDVYLATGSGAAARVEVTDSMTYANSTESVLLVPTSWSSSSITVTSYGDTWPSPAYLHVFDANDDLITSRSL